MYDTVRALTAVVEDELLQAGELSAGGDVEAAAVQLPDLVMFHIQAFGVVVVEHRQAVGPCKDDTQAQDSQPQLDMCATAARWSFPNSCVRGQAPPGSPPPPPPPPQGSWKSN